MGWDNEGYSGGGGDSWGAQRESNSWDTGKADGGGSWDRGGETNDQWDYGPKKEFMVLPDDHPYVKMSVGIEDMLDYIKGLKETHLQIKELEEMLEKEEQTVAEGGAKTTATDEAMKELLKENIRWKKEDEPGLMEKKADWEAKLEAIKEKVKDLSYQPPAEEPAAVVEDGEAENYNDSSWGQQAESGGDDYNQGSSWDRGGDSW